jgi:hypothetical protein
MSEFYTIETPPPSSSTSKDSLDESMTLFQSKKRMKLIGQISNCKTDEVRDIFFNRSIQQRIYQNKKEIIERLNNI